MKIDKTRSITHTKYWARSGIRTSKSKVPIVKFFQNFINKFILGKLGLEIRRIQTSHRLEQKSFTKDPNILKIRDERIANYLIEFGTNYEIHFEKDLLLKNFTLFEQIFREDKISDLNGGMGYNNGLFLFILISHLQPNAVIESGVWRGFTTYLIDKAIPKNGKIYCFDINMDRVEFESNKASYFEQDLSQIDDVDYAKVDFAFFDDHVSIYDRLKLCVSNKIKFVVVDDDVSLTQVHSDGWPPIPTASMLYEYDLLPKKFSWITNGEFASSDISDLDVSDICNFYRYVPFPKLGDFTGYKDFSFTSLLISYD